MDFIDATSRARYRHRQATQDDGATLAFGRGHDVGGPKGTITLSLMFTIPYTITGGAWFPMRDELIFIAGGVIVVTLLLANFLLPRWRRIAIKTLPWK